MRIAFDLHGVLQAHPDMLRSFLRSLRVDNKIIVLSGPPLKQIQDELFVAGYIQSLHYDEVISVVDWIKSKGIEMTLNKNGSWETDEETWWSSKAKICTEYGIDMLMDDSIQYKKYINGDRPLFLHLSQ